MTGICLFNFSASHRGGGLKRLQEYARWFDSNGGASFIIHPNCADLAERFPANRYFPVVQSGFARFVDDESYLDAIIAETGMSDLYYAYGIPMYRRVARVNWFHLSNVIPFNLGRIPLPAIDYLKQPYLAWRYRRNLRNADVASAESTESLRHLDVGDASRLFVSVNGSDDEIAHASMPPVAEPQDTAVVVGTYKYKAIHDSYQVFQALKKSNRRLRLIIIGVADQVPDAVREASDVSCVGLLPRADVIAHLARASFYISTTLLENSYNAASEGIFLAGESVISDIPPHRELLGDGVGEMVKFAGVERPLIRVIRGTVPIERLQTWDQVITDMLKHTSEVIDQG